MNSPENNIASSTRSVMGHAAHAGLPMGLYLTAVSMCLLGSLKVDVLPILMLPLVCGIPIVLYRLMKRTCTEDPSCCRVSSLWLMGIYTFIFGSLICALVSNLYIVFIEPGFVKDYIMMAIRDLESSPNAEAFASQIDLMHRAVEGHALPGSMQFVASMAWTTCFFGSLLSLITARVLTWRRASKRSGFPG